jgi:PAS domain S-box-containing protein
VGNGLILKAQGYRTSQDIVGSGFFWVIGALSALTVWMLLGTWRHTRRRVQAQQALVAETNFRRAMENSMLTGMRALDMQGRITYVNPAFCSMTGWTEAELVGRTAPFPYWPPTTTNMLAARLEDELQRPLDTRAASRCACSASDGGIFDARMYVSPADRPQGSPDRLDDLDDRHHRAQAHPRGTLGLLRALHHGAGVAGLGGLGAPLGSDEMLFANRMYRLWFGTRGLGHRTWWSWRATSPRPARTTATRWTPSPACRPKP